jgi:hypothetical protein
MLACLGRAAWQHRKPLTVSVGWEEAHKFREDHPPETRQDVIIGVV